eukprot:m.100033 g.100033  ORF g.100033 m.100033 type:complete len:475 (+) comp15114_c0_seq4:121-1545(+)
MGQNASRELRKPVKDYIVEDVTTNDPAVVMGSCSVQGYRHQMEDAHVCLSDLLQDGSHVSLALCFDGHGGPGAAIFAAKQFPVLLREAFQTNPDALKTSEAIEIAIVQAAVSLDDVMRKEQIEYLTEQDMEDPGTTCVGVLVTSSHVVLINVGDSRGILARGMEPVLSTRDHKPSHPIETKRIVDAGGFVASNRVCQSLGVARAFGDHLFKDPGLPPDERMVSCIPDVTVLPRDEELEFVVLACDGVFDVLSSETTVKILREQLLQQPTISKVCQTVVDDALHRNSTDNITCMLVTLDGAKRLDQVSDMLDDLFDLGDDEEMEETAAAVPQPKVSGKPALKPKPALLPKPKLKPSAAAQASKPNIPDDRSGTPDKLDKLDKPDEDETAALAALSSLLDLSETGHVSKGDSQSSSAPAAVADNDDNDDSIDNSKMPLPDMKKLTVVRRRGKKSRATAKSMFQLQGDAAGEDEEEV